MKHRKLRVLKCCILLLTAFFLLQTMQIFAQENNKNVTNSCQEKSVELDKLAGETQSYFKENKLDRAYKSAKKAVDLAEEFCADDKERRLALALNLAQVEMERKRYNEARIIFEDNLELAETVYENSPAKLDSYLGYLKRLSDSKFSDGKISDEQIEQYLLKRIETKEKAFGKESPEMVSQMVALAKFYERTKSLDKAKIYFLRAIEINTKLQKEKKTTKDSALITYRLFLIKHYGAEGKIEGDELAREQSKIAVFDENDKRILNGAAIKLEKPDYPYIATKEGAKGTVNVQVTIDENGKIIKAEAVSGNLFLHGVSEIAAKKSEFLITFVNGKPVQVKGIIVYNFIR